MSTVSVFEPPDTIAALPRIGFRFTQSAREESDAIIALPPEQLFHRLLADQESEAVLLTARRVIAAFLAPAEQALATGGAGDGDDAPDATAIAAEVGRARAGLADVVGTLRRAESDALDAVLRQRAPIGLIGGCWLDVLSQPATQPSVIVNRLFAQHYIQRGEGNPRRSLHQLRRAALEAAGVYLPETGAAEFLSQAGARPLTCLHGSFYLAMSRLPASFLPELVGVHYAFHALGVDDLLTGLPPMLPEPALRAVLAEYLQLAGPAERRRLTAGLRLVLDLEREHVAMLAELAAWSAGRTLESKVASVIARHAPFAGRHHGRVRVGRRTLAEAFADPGLDLAGFLRDFRESPQLRADADELCRFIRAVKFGGPMFGIFSEREAAVFKAWAESVQAGDRPQIVITACTAGDADVAARSAAVAASWPADILIEPPGTPDHRQLFYRLVNIESFAHTLPIAAERAERLFAEAEILFSRGAEGRYTDASYFDYSPQALQERIEQVYWRKLVQPYRPLDQVPDADEVIFLQTTYALGALIDAAWIHRIANLGRFERRSDAALFTIYADEVGHGDLRKNHITLIHRALHSMGIRMPHIRDAAFMDQADLPDELYGFSLHQLCMALFPDTYYTEILGYNLAIEMFGLGELRLHEIQKLRHHGFDDCYEQAHLTIDNLSAGHSRQAADIIVAYLDDVRRTLGEAAVQAQWRRIWRGYASLAYFVEHALLKRLATPAPAFAPVPVPASAAGLLDSVEIPVSAETAPTQASTADPDDPDGPDASVDSVDLVI
jgi:Iron-containing redox enzyme